MKGFLFNKFSFHWFIIFKEMGESARIKQGLIVDLHLLLAASWGAWLEPQNWGLHLTSHASPTSQRLFLAWFLFWPVIESTHNTGQLWNIDPKPKSDLWKPHSERSVRNVLGWSHLTQNWHQMPLKGSIRIRLNFLLILVFVSSCWLPIFILSLYILTLIRNKNGNVEMFSERLCFALLVKVLTSSGRSKKIEGFTKKLIWQDKNLFLPQEYPYYKYGLSSSNMKNVGFTKI